MQSEEGRYAVRVTGDRVLCEIAGDDDRRTKAGIVIPATATSTDRRGLWAVVTQVGPLVQTIIAGDQVLFLPDAAVEVDVRGEVFHIVREREVHAIASERSSATRTGLYL